ncbi:hypothetical protein DRP77_05145 [Candidatus Poribacteria bacterium]|nr:MAG: hypothetical protein DRP77_05145 [Candidatus Poribacteria bacterium]
MIESIAFISAFLWTAALQAEPADRYLIEGVYYLICEGDATRAERELLLSAQLNPDDPDPLYFLGLIKYQRGEAARSKEEIGEALYYLLEAEEKGIKHDRLRPDILSEIKERFPGIKPRAIGKRPSSDLDEVEIRFETEKGEVVLLRSEDRSEIRSVSKVLKLRCGRTYKVDLDRMGTLNRAFKRIIPIAVILALWISR